MRAVAEGETLPALQTGRDWVEGSTQGGGTKGVRRGVGVSVVKAPTRQQLAACGDVEKLGLTLLLRDGVIPT